MDEPGKIFQLKRLMASVHELAELAWPEQIPIEATDVILEIQVQACLILDLPDNLDLTDGSI